MMPQRARAIVPLEYKSCTKLQSSTTTPLMKIVEHPFLPKKLRNVHSGEKVVTAAMKLNSALSIFLDTYVLARAIRLNRMNQKNRNIACSMYWKGIKCLNLPFKYLECSNN